MEPVDLAYNDLEQAFMWASSGAPFENEAWLSRRTGEVHLRGAGGDFGVELPPDLEDASLYAAVPHKNELDLGRTLAFTFLESHAPELVPTAQAFFRRRGAYAKFKALLERQQLLAQWYDHEAAATKRALEAWASDNGFWVVHARSR
jgi:hypothetical protein